MDKPKPSPEPLLPGVKLGVPLSRTWPDGSTLIITSDAITLVEPRPAYSVSPCSTDSSPVNPTSYRRIQTDEKAVPSIGWEIKQVTVRGDKYLEVSGNEGTYSRSARLALRGMDTYIGRR